MINTKETMYFAKITIFREVAVPLGKNWIGSFNHRVVTLFALLILVSEATCIQDLER